MCSTIALHYVNKVRSYTFNVQLSIIQKNKTRESVEQSCVDDIGNDFITRMISLTMCMCSVKCQQDHTHLLMKKMDQLKIIRQDLVEDWFDHWIVEFLSDWMIVIRKWNATQIIFEWIRAIWSDRWKSILLIQIDWIELSWLSHKTRLVFETADDLQHERRVSCLMQQSSSTSISIPVCSDLKENQKLSNFEVLREQSREVNMLIFICLSLITDDAYTSSRWTRWRREKEERERREEKFDHRKRKTRAREWEKSCMFDSSFSFNFRLWRRHGHQ